MFGLSALYRVWKREWFWLCIGVFRPFGVGNAMHGLEFSCLHECVLDTSYKDGDITALQNSQIGIITTKYILLMLHP
jgi:hypothetical protein